MTDELKPRNHAEKVALFRYSLIGGLVAREFDHGELHAELGRLAQLAVRPPGSKLTHVFGASTYETWFYAYRKGGLEALKPRRRCDAGNGRTLNADQLELLLAIRRERPSASTSLVLRTLEEDGRLPRGLIRAATLRRIYAEHGLNAAQSRQLAGSERDRRRWVAPHPNAVWHADVCHGPAMKVGDQSVPLRIHALLDDHSRYVLAILASRSEREVDMLELLLRAWRGHGVCETLYLDNGSTYRGDVLQIACGRLNVNLRHARPYDPQARGKMERFWGTLRDQCLSHMGPMSSLHDVQARLLAWLDRHYLVAPHASLMGKSPSQVYLAAERTRISEQQLRDALTVEVKRRIGGDGTLSIGGTLFEAKQGFLAGVKVSVLRTLADPTAAPWVEYEGKRLELVPVDAVANGSKHRKMRKATGTGIDALPFDPPTAYLNRRLGKVTKKAKKVKR